MQIFQVLNDRGQPLSPIDILKSNLMQEIKQDSEKRKDFITTWDKLVEACKSIEGIDIDLEDFFTCIWNTLILALLKRGPIRD
ncbi:DUF262 domain-containing protein [Helicobacter pylori]|uniref:DUF262 domain-containing protein n=1 Tax=Helicobacter pylori TaxID=210 RepID=UPI0003A191AA|nr:DUF262 domain-containing protein [Helicobacter pylori]